MNLQSTKPAVSSILAYHYDAESDILASSGKYWLHSKINAFSPNVMKINAFSPNVMTMLEPMCSR